MIQTIDGAALKSMVLNAAAVIDAKKQQINDLNVFPVPDGDTGTNMSLTLNAAIDALAKLGPDAAVAQVADAAAGALLRGARGNSGVITSLLCRGFARGAKGLEVMGGEELATAMKLSSEVAYNAVMKPAEGTILTVSRLAGVRAQAAASECGDFEYVLEAALEEAKRALPETMEQNPVLKKAGVVDAGAMGYVSILDAALRALRGEKTEAPVQAKEKADFSSFETEDINFTYCTEFIIERSGESDANTLRSFLAARGDSLVLVDDEEIIKVHVHTDDPGELLHEAVKYGSFSMVKVENMRLQHTAKIEDSEPQNESAPAEPVKELGFVAVCAGSGLAEVFRQIGVDSLIEGGQTMNPSTQDILTAIEATPASTVIVLPNNKNIILSAQQCVPLCGKKVIVIPSRTVPEGISAMLMADPAASPEENEEAMNAALAGVRTMEVTFAARDAQFDGWDIHMGDYLALDNGKPFGTDRDISALLTEMAKSAAESGSELISIYYGEEVTEEQAAAAAAVFESACPDAEVSVLSGGQPVYYYIISLE